MPRCILLVVLVVEGRCRNRCYTKDIIMCKFKSLLMPYVIITSEKGLIASK